MYAAVDSRGVGWPLPQSQALKAPSCLATGESGSTSESPPCKGQILCIYLQLNLSGMPKPGPGAMVSQGVPQFSNIFQIEFTVVYLNLKVLSQEDQASPLPL